MAWVGTAYDIENGTFVEFHTPDHPNGKHGNYEFHIKYLHDKYGKLVEVDKPIHVVVHDNSREGVDNETVKKIAETACIKPIYWSDYRLCYWMYDFNIWNHWCEMIDVPDEHHWDCLHINIYE